MIRLRRTRHVAVSLTLTVVIAAVTVGAQAQAPAPGTPAEASQPASLPDAVQSEPIVDTRGTPDAPVVVQVLPTERTEEQAAAEQARADDQSEANWWMVRLIAVIIAMTVLQLIVNTLQARRLRETIEKLGEIAGGQAADMRASIAEAMRASTAMEDIAKSMRTSVQSVKDSLSISKQIADSQMLAIVLQNRAYLEVSDWRVFKPIDDAPPERLRRVGPRDAYVTYFIKNKGQTAATLHRVTQIIPTANLTRTHELELILEAGQSVQHGIPFKLPESHEAQMGLLGETFVVNVEVNYSDGFARRTKRFGREVHECGWAFGVKDEEQHWLVCGGTEWNREIEQPGDAESAEGQPEGPRRAERVG